MTATNICTWHDSSAAVACANICSEMMAWVGITAKRIAHPIWNSMKKSFVKRASRREPHDLRICAETWTTELKIRDPE